MSLIIYEHANYEGRHKHIINRNESNLHADGWGDKVSSAQVIGGTYRFHEHKNRRGRSFTVGPGSYPNLRNLARWNWNDKVSSVSLINKNNARVSTPGIILYEHSNFRGKHKHIINRSESNLHDDNWGDRISSIQVLSGTWRIYNHTRYRGWSLLLGPGSYAIIDGIGNSTNDSISSVRLESSNAIANNAEIILYEDTDYEGDHKHLINGGTRNLHADGWGDKVSSLQVLNGDNWQLFRDTNFNGQSSNLRVAGYNNSSSFGLSNDSVSSIRANIVPVATISLPSSTPNIMRDFNVANNIFNNVGISILNMANFSFNGESASRLTVLDQPNTPGVAGCTPNLLTDDTEELFEIGRDSYPKNIVCYYINSDTAGRRGCAAFPSGNPGFTVTNIATQFTFAHELAHVISGLGHLTPDSTFCNLLRPNTGSITCAVPQLNNSQTSEINDLTFLL